MLSSLFLFQYKSVRAVPFISPRIDELFSPLLFGVFSQLQYIMCSVNSHIAVYVRMTTA